MRRPTKKLIEPLPVALARRKERQIDVASGTLQVIAHRAFVHARNCAWAGMLNRGTDALFPRQGESHSVHVRYDLGSGFEGDGTGGFAWGGLDGYIDAVGRLLSFDETHAVSWRAWFAITAVPDPGRLLQHTCPQAGAHAANARRTIRRATSGWRCQSRSRSRGRGRRTCKLHRWARTPCLDFAGSLYACQAKITA